LDELDECPKGRTVKLKSENEEFEFYWQRIIPGIMRPDGSFDFQAITNIFSIYGLGLEAQQYLFDKCLIMIGLIREAREKKGKDGR
jgi:hypothetical protein